MNNITENASQASTSNNTSTTGAQQGQGQREDYLDKGLDAAEKKWGGAAGQDTEKNRGVNEKIVCLPHDFNPPFLFLFIGAMLTTAIDGYRTQHV